MSGPASGDVVPQGPQEGSSVPELPAGLDLAGQTSDFAREQFEGVAAPYLNFRRIYCQESNPSLDTVPPRTHEQQRTEGARLAAGALRLMPGEVHQVPLARDLYDHLQWVVDIHTLTDNERIQLHNLTMAYLHGVQDGIQPWFINWLVRAEHELHAHLPPKYFLAYPWQGIFFRAAHDLTGFDEAVRTGNVEGIAHEVKHIGDRFVDVLRDPLGTQPKLAFSGEDGERRKLIFDLKTAAGLALAAYVAVEAVRALTHPGEEPAPRSVITLPPELGSSLMGDDGQ
jgi:hypothetical protein